MLNYDRIVERFANDEIMHGGSSLRI